MSQSYDFRSDTVTKPTKEMLNFMMNCDFGDDVLIEDPTVKKLEEKVAKLFGKEAGLFVCSGTMSNQLACRVHLTEPTYQVIMDFNSHIYQYELGGVSYHSGCSYRPIKPSNGKYMTLKEVQENLWLKNDWHHPITKLITLENTTSGMIYPLEEMKKITALARKHSIKTHLDGARIWNASVKTGVSLAEYGKHFDTISACLSKGLGSPIGTVLVGTKADMQKARRYRKIFGGGWRQAGVLAGCGVYAIDNNWKSMKSCHEDAKFLGDELKKMGFEILPKVETNMVFTSTKKMKNISWKKIIEKLDKSLKVSLRGGNENLSRLVVHFQTPRKGVEFLLSEIKRVIDLLKK